jgi:aspartyl-tRNA(Asn)/glutamyl-tRNA(Gln) amidotransferase subunit C
MVRIVPQDVKYVAHLARIGLTEEEIERFTGQLTSILDYVNKLNQVSPENIEPTSHVLPLKNVFRDDKVLQSLSVEDAMKNACEKEGNFFKVPKIIE